MNIYTLAMGFVFYVLVAWLFLPYCVMTHANCRNLEISYLSAVIYSHISSTVMVLLVIMIDWLTNKAFPR